MKTTSRFGQAVGAYGRVIQSPSYFPLWLAQLFSSFGDTLHYIALVVLVFQLTGQGGAVGEGLALDRAGAAAALGDVVVAAR